MALPLIPNEGKRSLMGAVMASIAGGANGSRVHLFGNLLTPTLLTSVGDFVEMTFAGYAAVPLPAVLDRGIDGLGRDIWIFDAVVFTATGAGLPAAAYGYWIDWLNPITGLVELLWCQRLDVGFAFVSPGDQLPLNLTLGGTQG